MALKARNIEPAQSPATPMQGASEPALDPHQIIECLELESRNEIDDAPRGIVFGVLLGAVVWSAISLILALVL